MNKTSGKDVEKVEDRVKGVTKVDDISIYGTMSTLILKGKRMLEYSLW